MKHFKEEIIRDIFNDAVVVTTKVMILMFTMDAISNKKL